MAILEDGGGGGDLNLYSYLDKMLASSNPFHLQDLNNNFFVTVCHAILILLVLGFGVEFNYIFSLLFFFPLVTVLLDYVMTL